MTNPIFPFNQLNAFTGIRLVESLIAGTFDEDWSDCRSPSRAMRRRRQGHEQRIKTVFKPGAFEIGGVIYIHPLLMKKLQAELNRRVDEDMRSALFHGLRT